MNSNGSASSPTGKGPRPRGFRLLPTAANFGQPMLIEWLKDLAGQFDRRDLSRTLVATRPDEVLVVGKRLLHSVSSVSSIAAESSAW
jgi:hypothetical protein